MGGVGPACRRFVRYFRNRVFRPFFTRLRKIAPSAGKGACAGAGGQVRGAPAAGSRGADPGPCPGLRYATAEQDAAAGSRRGGYSWAWREQANWTDDQADRSRSKICVGRR